MNTFPPLRLRRRLLLPLILAALAGPCAAAQGGDLVADTRIRVNSVGFPALAEKQATVAGPGGGFSVRRIDDGAVVLVGRTGAPQHTAKSETNEVVSVLDFSALRTPGRYVLEVEGIGRSVPFTVADDALNPAFHLVTRAFYLFRCGVAVSGENRGELFRHDPCHLEDGWLDKLTGEHRTRPGTGGWHDAGDYNKYVVNAGVTTGLMFKAWEHFRGRVAGVRLDIPESGNRTPDLLDELRFEYEWLFTMQLEDGRVLHKLSSADFRYWGSPERDKGPRYFSDWSSTATADFTAMMALGARHFREFDAAFADRCLQAANKSWAFLLANPGNRKPDLSGFKTGGYDVPDDSHRLWAAAELYETTGDTATLAEFEKHAQGKSFSFSGPSWGDVQDLALGTYLESRRSGSRDSRLMESLRGSLLEQAERICAVGKTNAYGRGLGGQRPAWNWGVNGTVAGQTYLLHLADRLEPNPAYRQAALGNLSHLLGRNFYGRSFVTGLGALPPQHPHDRRGEPAWPGNLVGGSWPDGRSWKDELASYQTNEIAINWNGALCYALAAFVQALEVTHAGAPVFEGDPEPVAGERSRKTSYTFTNKSGAPLSLDRIELQLTGDKSAPRAQLSAPLLIEAGASATLDLGNLSDVQGPWLGRVSVYYNGDTDHPFVWNMQVR